MQWNASVVVSESRGLDRFSHVAHFASPSDNACLTCHVLDRDAKEDFLTSFLQRDQHVFTPSFENMTKATCTEAGLLAEAGLDVVVLGAGTSVGNVHRPNEHTRISQLAQARDLYREVIERLCVVEA